MKQPSQYEDFEVSELYCARCKRSVKVRKHLLIVLPQGNKYDYRCTVCGESVGSKMDNEASDFNIVLPR